MVQGVRKHDIAAPYERGYRTDVGHVARGIDDCGISALERGDMALERLVGWLRAGYEARSPRAGAELNCGIGGG